MSTRKELAARAEAWMEAQCTDPEHDHVSPACGCGCHLPCCYTD